MCGYRNFCVIGNFDAVRNFDVMEILCSMEIFKKGRVEMKEFSNKLFPQIEGLVHGGDYNPEQWLDRPDILLEDVRMMKKAGINCVSLGIFSWSVYEPVEGEYHFQWLVDCIDRLYQNGIYTILATPSGARPAWLDEKYPEALRVDAMGMRYHHGVRENHCMSSPVFRQKVQNIINMLHQAVGDHPGVIMWHISNEFNGQCYCPLCVGRFREYLRNRFEGDIEKLNKAWWTSFWSHQYQSFEQVEPPYENGEYSIMGLQLEWRRFTTWNMTDYMLSEIKLLRCLTPQRPVTTNFMQLYGGLNYREMAPWLDVISWDSYPRFHNDSETLEDTMLRSAFDHAVMRSMKRDKPFMLMESAPGLVNWHEYNKLKRPGIHKLFSLQAVGCGSDTVQYFQWRKGRGSYEQYHGAVVDHLGTDDTRIFKEVEDLGRDLLKIGEVAGSLVRPKVALLLDWEVMWALQDMRGLSDATKQYDRTCAELFAVLSGFGLDVDVIDQKDDFTGYQAIVAPMLYLLQDGTADRMKQYVEAGGHLLATYLTGYVDKNTLCFLGGFPGDGLKDLFGIISEEIDTLYPRDRNAICFQDGTEAVVKDYAEILRVQDAEVLACYKEDFYAGKAAVTVRRQGKGKACYVACRLEKDGMKKIFARFLEAAGIAVKTLPEGVEYHERSDAEGRHYAFYLNLNPSPVIINGINGRELLSGENVQEKMTLPGWEAAVIGLDGTPQ